MLSCSCSSTCLLLLPNLFFFQDASANYVTLTQNSLSICDFSSDIFMLYTLKNAEAQDQFLPFFYVGATCLFVAVVGSVLAAHFILLSEIKRKQDFAAYLKNHKLATLLCIYVGAIFKSNYFLHYGSPPQGRG